MDTDLASLVPVESVIEEKTATAVGFYQIEVDSEVALEAGSGMLEKSWSLESDGASSDVSLTAGTSEDEDGGYLQIFILGIGWSLV